MTTSSRAAKGATTKSTASSQLPLEFSGREPLPFILTLPQGQRLSWLLARLEAYRDASVHFASVVTRERTGKATVAEAEAQAVIETEGLTKAIALEAPLYPLLVPDLAAKMWGELERCGVVEPEGNRGEVPCLTSTSR